MTLRRMAVLLTAVIGASSLGACTSDSNLAIPEPTVVSAPTHSDAATDAPTGPGTQTGLCEGMPSVSAAVPGVNGYIYGQLRDVGPLEGARGEVSTDDEGQPVSYVVAAGDTATAIAARFCIDYRPYLGWLNAVRRNGVANLYAGDTLNLSPFRITSVGNENGVALQNDLNFSIPPQQ